jgi:hypothetical protein
MGVPCQKKSAEEKQNHRAGRQQQKAKVGGRRWLPRKKSLFDGLSVKG